MDELQRQIKSESSEDSKLQLVNLRQKNSESEEKMKGMLKINDQMKVIIKVIKEENDKCKLQVNDYVVKIKEKDGLIGELEGKVIERESELRSRRQEYEKSVQGLNVQVQSLFSDKSAIEKERNDLIKQSEVKTLKIEERDRELQQLK